RVAIEANDALSKRFRIFRFNQNAVADDFGNRGRARGHNGFLCRHSFQEDNSEALLNAGQTEDIGAVIFRSQGAPVNVAEPAYGGLQMQVGTELPQFSALRAIPDNANLELRNPVPQQPRSSEQYV